MMQEGATQQDELVALRQRIAQLEEQLTRNQKDAETSLRESQEYYRELVEGTDDLVVQVDACGMVIFVNHRSNQLLDLAPNECIGTLCFSYVHPDDRERTEQAFQQWIVQRLQSTTFETRIVNRLGQVYDMLWTINLHYDHQGTITAINTIARDISTRKQAEQEMIRSRALLQAILDSTAEGIAVFEKDSGITSCNRRFEELWRLPPDWHTIPSWSERSALMIEHLNDPWQFIRQIEEISGDMEQGICTVVTFRDGRVLELHSAPYRVENRVVGQVWSILDASQRIYAERAMRQSQERLQAIYDNAAVAIALTDPHGRFLEINRQGTAMFGYTTEEMCQFTILDLTHPDDRNQTRNHLSLLVAGKIDGYHLEKRYFRKDGSTFWAHLAVRGIFNDDGEVVGVVGIVTDITKRKHAEDALRESQANLLALLENTSDIIASRDGEGRLVYYNSAFARIVKRLFNVEAKPGLRTTDYLPEAQQQHWENILARVMTGERHHEEFAWDYGIQGVRWYEISFNPIIKDGTIIGTTEFNHDITERKQAEDTIRTINADLEARVASRTEELQHNRDLLETIFDGIPDGLVLLGSNGRVLAANRSLAGWLGQDTPESLVNQSWGEVCLLMSETGTRFPGLWVLDVLQDHKPHHRRETYQRKDGTACVLDMHTLPIITSNNEDVQHQTVERVVLHIVDVTERLRIEQLQLENERLDGIRKISQVVAHEVNTPLQTILNSLEGLSLGNETHRDRFLTLAQTEIERVGTILHRLQEPFSYNETTPSLVGIAGLLEQVLTLTSTTMRKQHIVIERDIAPNLPPILARPDQLFQVFLNLLLNAIEAMPDGGIITIICRRTWGSEGGTYLGQQENGNNRTGADDLLLKDPGSIRVEVRDTGVGIAPDDQEHIFESFFTTKKAGTGLGLTVSQKIIQEHQGSIRVESQPGVGSTFIINLPIVQG